MRRLLPILLLSALAACGPRQSQDAAAAAPAPSASPAPAETDPPNARGQRPAFPGQTRAPALTTTTAFQVQTVAKGLDHPWGEAFLPDGRMLLTERVGRLRILTRGGALSPPASGAPRVVTGEQAGLFGLALDPGFARNGLIYFAYMERRPGGLSGLSVARAKLSEAGGGPALNGLTVIFRAQPAMSGLANIGGRLVFAPDGTLFVTVGDRFEPTGQHDAQTLDNDLGKIIRINPDGSAPKDNPFVGKPGARPEIWSYGHRNPESAAINPWTHQLWTVEHGPRGGDEVNIPQAGKNYGWPVISYGEDYSGRPVGQGINAHAGMEQPIYYWDPVIAPSGMAFYDANLFPAWKGNLFVGGLASTHLARLTLAGARVVGEEWLLQDLGERIRDVIVGPDGALYVLTDNSNGRVLRIAPK
ncbi:MAG: glucose dehydrogenase [Phenylobacterium sp.]|nr:glucose dehydrogenase [Phenylobacterium sp.]MDB5493474.1 glucose dehydrogenase [Phenylobacterium sp.]